MIIEVRSYKVKPDLRAEFIQFFEAHSIPLHRSFGMMIFGPMLDLEDTNTFVWLRGFPSAEVREQMRAAFYGSDTFLQDIEPVLIPMLESYDIRVCEASVSGMYEGREIYNQWKD
jgi:hypothetical protein